MRLGSLTGRILLVGAAAALLSGTAVALATGGGDPAIYKACVKSTDKTLYNVLVNPRSGPTCRTGDKVISWNEEGPRGPQGPRAPQGPPGQVILLPDGFNIVEMRSSSVGIGGTATGGSATATCPDDYAATGGGFEVSGTTVDYVVRFNGPRGPSSTQPEEWHVDVHFAEATDATITAWVLCAGVTSN